MTPILDNGHGGVIGGRYVTAGKRSPEWHLGTLYEGEFNRAVVNRLIERLNAEGVAFYHVSPELDDVSLAERVRRANWITENHSEHTPYLLSIHANAGGGTGLEVFTSPGETTSDKIASTYVEELERGVCLAFGLPMRKDFADGDPDKEALFYVLRKTKCPAILVELGFMDNPTDYKLLHSDRYRRACVDALFSAIVKLRS